MVAQRRRTGHSPSIRPHSAWRAFALTALASVVPLLLIRLDPDRFLRVFDSAAYLVFHNVAELFGVVVSLSIFGIVWFARDLAEDRRVLFLGCAFLGIGLLDAMHALGYSDMPALVTPNSPAKSTQFWIAARSFNAAAFLASAFVAPHGPRAWLTRRVLATGVLALSAAVFVGVTFFPEALPATYVPGVGLTPFKRNAELVIAAALLASVLAYATQAVRTGDRALARYVAAFTLCAASELVLADYKSVFDSYNVLAHVYKVVAFLLIYRAVFVACVRSPYRELAASRGALLEAQRIAGIGSWRWELERGRVTWSEELDRIMGRDPARRPPAPPAIPELFPAESRAPLRAALERARSEGAPWELELVVEAGGAGAARRQLIARGEAVRDDAGQVVRLQGTVQDVSEQRRMADELRQAQKMEAIGRLAGGVAHDFNNLLTAILGCAGSLSEQVEDEGPLREEVRGIEEAANRAAALTRQLLAFARRQVVQPRVVDPGQVLAAMESMLRRIIGEDVALTTAIAPGAGRVRIDPGQLEQVILNLAVNARDAMPGGGRLEIELEPEQGGGRGGMGRVLLRVSDTGSGMDAATRAHLFEPFFTTKAIGCGTGLGLSTVLGIVQQAGGTIAVETAPERGTTFRIALPRVHDPADGPTPDPDPPERPSVGATVLVAEDEPSVRGLAVRALRRAGYTVLEAPDGAEALRMARATHVDLLVSDVVMPLLHGDELARRITLERPGLRVLLVTGYPGRSSVAPGHDGPWDLLQKPFTPAELLARVAALQERPDGPAERPAPRAPTPASAPAPRAEA